MLDFTSEQKKERIENDTYLTKLENCKISEYKGKKQFDITFTIVEGKHSGRKIYYHIPTDKDNPNEFDKKGLEKIIVYGQDSSGRKVFENYDDLAQYLNSGIYMNVTTELQMNMSTGAYYDNPAIRKFTPGKAPVNKTESPKESKPSNAEDEGLPF